MGAALGLSVWFALVTVVPGLVTIAVVWGAIVLVGEPGMDDLSGADPTVAFAGAVAVMVFTQAFGILLEERVLVPRRMLGPEWLSRILVRGPDGEEQVRAELRPYQQYEDMYVLLAELRDEDDVRGHLERAVAQFFLTVNTSVAVAAGALATVVVAVAAGTGDAVVRGSLYGAALLTLLVVNSAVARSRFAVMAWSLWAARRRIEREHPRAMPGS